jgi:hypothetical protein
MGIAVWQAMECGCWTLPHVASMKVIVPPVSMNHWTEVSTLAHHVDTKSILKPLIVILQTGKSTNQGVVWHINHVVNFFLILICYVLHQCPCIIKNIDIVDNINVKSTLKGEQGWERRFN